MVLQLLCCIVYLHIIIINTRDVVVHLYDMNAHLVYMVFYKYKVLPVIGLDRNLNNMQIIVNIKYYIIKKKNRSQKNRFYFILFFELPTPFKWTTDIMNHFRPKNYKSNILWFNVGIY